MHDADVPRTSILGELRLLILCGLLALLAALGGGDDADTLRTPRH